VAGTRPCLAPTHPAVRCVWGDLPRSTNWHVAGTDTKKPLAKPALTRGACVVAGVGFESSQPGAREERRADDSEEGLGSVA